MAINGPTKAADFNRIAPFYDLLARLVFGKTLEKAQFVHLSKIPTGSRVLVLGGGSGWILTGICTKSKAVRIDYIEASEQMLSMSKSVAEAMELSEGPEIIFHHGTQALLPELGQFDVVICFFYFDLFEEQAFQEVFRLVDEHLIENGLLFVADFFNEKGNLFHQGLIRLMYLFFRWATRLKNKRLPPLKATLTNYSYECMAHTSYRSGLVQSLVMRKTQK